MERIAQLGAKLSLLRVRDGNCQLIGANHHKYALNAPLVEKEVADFEVQHQLALPADYRAFLATLGNGGAGPFFGMVPLQDSILTSDLIDDPMILSKSFPLGQAVELSELIKAHTEFDLFADDDSLDTYYRRIEEDREFREINSRLETQFHSSYFSRGSLMICDYGCGLAFRLIVSGDARGQIWLDDRANDSGLYPLGDPYTAKPVDFLAWYDQWLDHSLRSIDEFLVAPADSSIWPWSSIERSDGRVWPWGQ
jgi:hypothetical protein